MPTSISVKSNLYQIKKKVFSSLFCCYTNCYLVTLNFDSVGVRCFFFVLLELESGNWRFSLRKNCSSCNDYIAIILLWFKWTQSRTWQTEAQQNGVKISFDHLFSFPNCLVNIETNFTICMRLIICANHMRYYEFNKQQP